MHLTKVNTSSI